MKRAIAIGFLVAAVIVVAASPASAHALLERSDPSDGQILSSAPSKVTIWFTEEPDPGLSLIQVLDSSGQTVSAGAAQPVPGDAKALQVPLRSGLGNGVYTVSWRAVSRVDGHVTANSFSFGVGVKPPTGPPTVAGSYSTPGPSPLSVAGRAALYTGLSLLLASGVLGVVVFHGIPGRGRTLAVGWAIAAAGGIAMTAAERATVGIGLTALLRSETGAAFVRLLVALAVAGVAVLIAWRRPVPIALELVGAAAAAALLVRVDGGHAAAGGGIGEVALQWLHVLSVGIWVGGLALLGVSLRSDPPAGITEVKLFSTIAGFALATVAVSGVARAANALGGYAQFLHEFSTSYGTALFFKTVGAILLISFGAWNRYRSIPRIERTGDTSMLRRVATGEVAIAAGILVVTGILTGLPPAALQKPPAAPASSNAVAYGSDFGTTTKVRLTADPGTVGPNTFTAHVTDYDTGAPVAASRVQLTFMSVGRSDIGSTSLDLTKGTNGDWSGSGTELSFDGAWNISTLVQTSSGGVTVPLTLFTTPPPSTTTASVATGQPTVYTIKLSDGRSIQTYNDPGTAGADELHVTAFDTTGNELPIRSALVIAVPPGGEPRSLPVRRLDTGHFVADAQLTAGRWRFAEVLAARGGGSLYVTFDQTIGA